MANLPIIQPLLRKGASKIGLSVLFSSARGGTGSYGRRRGESYPLASREGNTQTATKKSRTRLSVHEGTITAGYGSDEEGLVGTGKKGKMRDITVTQETVIETEPAGKEPEGTGRFDWGRRE